MATINRPYSAIDQLQEEVNRLFSGRGVQARGDSSYGEADWIPAVDIKETPTAYILHADLPGVDPAEVEMTLDRNVLRIKGGRQTQPAGAEETYRRSERVTGTFFRQFTLPDEVDREGIEARSSHGVLEILIPKGAAATPRQISIST